MKSLWLSDERGNGREKHRRMTSDGHGPVLFYEGQTRYAVSLQPESLRKHVHIQKSAVE